MKKTSVFLVSVLIWSVFGAALVFAQTPSGPGGTSPSGPGGTSPTGDISVNVNFPNPFARGGDSLFDFLKTVIDNILLPIGGILAVLAFIYSGFLYVTAQGDEAKIKTAHKALLYTAIGTAVLLGSWVIANVIENTIRQLR